MQPVREHKTLFHFAVPAFKTHHINVIHLYLNSLKTGPHLQ